jgi:4-amino-4-deoxy-L-arabinose transferase-like glycosyltransferase
MKSATRDDHSDVQREIRIIAILTVIGAVLRFWGLPRLGLNHFDEGIYALAGLWIYSPHGLIGIDPTTIAYAPPGLVTLIGLSYWLFGVGDYAAILVSLVAGTLTIPAVGWVAAQTFGRRAGAAAAALAAVAGPHIVFSRMALTDTLFLLFWTITLGLAQRFLEKPGPVRSGLLGLGVGLSQLVKYNGYLLGIIALASACLWIVADHRRQRASRWPAIVGWGTIAALVSMIIYAPWFQFVETHGGYAALLAHHRSYLGGVGSWPSYLWVQLAEARLLSGGPLWTVGGGALALLAVWICLAGVKSESARIGSRVLQLSTVLAISASPNLGWWVTSAWLCAIPVLLIAHARFDRASTVIAMGALTLLILTPFYHPYARLWLPLHAFGWIVCGGLIATIARPHWWAERLASMWPVVRSGGVIWLSSACLLGVFAGEVYVTASRAPRPVSIVGGTDSLRIACAAIRAEVPKNVSRIRLYARPPVTFYLGGELPLEPMPSWDRMLGRSDSGTWAILDSAMLRQEGRSAPWNNAMGRDWVLVKSVDANLSPGALLDIDPSSALNDSWDDSTAILLFRPALAGTTR